MLSLQIHSKVPSSLIILSPKSANERWNVSYRQNTLVRSDLANAWHKDIHGSIPLDQNEFITSISFSLCGINLWFKYSLSRSSIHPNFDLPPVQTHDLPIIDSTFHVPETLTITTTPSGSSMAWNGVIDFYDRQFGFIVHRHYPSNSVPHSNKWPVTCQRDYLQRETIITVHGSLHIMTCYLFLNKIINNWREACK